jgi:hypothetical protein
MRRSGCEAIFSDLMYLVVERVCLLCPLFCINLKYSFLKHSFEFATFCLLNSGTSYHYVVCEKSGRACSTSLLIRSLPDGLIIPIITPIKEKQRNLTSIFKTVFWMRFTNLNCCSEIQPNSPYSSQKADLHQQTVPMHDCNKTIRQCPLLPPL